MLGSRTLGWNSPILALFDTGETIFCCCFCLLLSHSLVSQSLSCDISCQMLYRFPLLFPLPVHTLAVYLHQRPPLPTGVLPPLLLLLGHIVGVEEEEQDQRRMMASCIRKSQLLFNLEMMILETKMTPHSKITAILF